MTAPADSPAAAESSTAVDPPARPPRPVTVTIAFWCQVAAVVVLLGLCALPRPGRPPAGCPEWARPGSLGRPGGLAVGPG
ncbi:hypothetical protein GA0070616_2717 [Micromonospora nigra]|uniref:Uncharacterized protein n=1 Tax=Micromonospora nigra TaxID=145857 RepID=A0A1C6S234_9ACTN|nr:hypothetical protein [Micromonospora nigra]SCL23382.1 hypothetical protein GA0070616_2717 [Micromonospora nigra]